MYCKAVVRKMNITKACNDQGFSEDQSIQYWNNKELLTFCLLPNEPTIP